MKMDPVLLLFFPGWSWKWNPGNAVSSDVLLHYISVSMKGIIRQELWWRSKSTNPSRFWGSATSQCATWGIYWISSRSVLQATDDELHTVLFIKLLLTHSSMAWSNKVILDAVATLMEFLNGVGTWIQQRALKVISDGIVCQSSPPGEERRSLWTN